MTPRALGKSTGGAAFFCAVLFLSACGGGGGGGGEPATGGGAAGGGLFLRGSFNEWDAREKHRLSATGGGSYVLTVTLSRGAHEFKIADAEWRAQNNFGGEVVADVGAESVLIRGANSANKILVAGADGEYVFRFNPRAGALEIEGDVVADGSYRPGGNPADRFNNLRTYQVMVEAFQNGDDGVNYNTGWGPSAHKGDLRGIINALDYIAALNVNALWLTPIFDSRPRNGAATKLDATGYYARNFFRVDPNFGTMEDARELVSQAHARGLSVFFDGVFGHWHRDGVVARNGLSPAVKNPISDIGYEADYGNPETLEFFKAVATFWIDDIGIDGWRLDQAYQVPIEAWREIRAATDAAGIRNGKPAAHLFGEFWRTREQINREAYGTAENPALESAFDFPGREMIFQNVFAARDPRAEQLRAAMLLQRHYPDHARPGMFVGNHDIPRFGDLLQRSGIGTDDDNPGAEYWARHRLAASFLSAHTGPIFTYYGEEIGRQLPGFVNQNPDCGVGTVWCDDHVSRDDGKIANLNADERALRDYYAESMSLRAAHPALWNGAGFNLRAAGKLYADLKIWRGATPDDDEAIVHLMNLGALPLTVALTESDLRAAGGRATLITDLRGGATTAPGADGSFAITLPPLSSQLLSVSADSSALIRNARATDGKGSSLGLWADARLELPPSIAGLAAGLSEWDFPLALPDGRPFASRVDSGRVDFARRPLSAPDALARFHSPEKHAPARPALGGQLRGAADGFVYERQGGDAGGRFLLEYHPRNFSDDSFSRFSGGGKFFPSAGESPHLNLISDGMRALGAFSLSGGRAGVMIFSDSADSDNGARAAAAEWRGGRGAWRFGVQAGGLWERGAFLGARGFGPLALGDSETFFGGLWGERKFGDAALFASADGGFGRMKSSAGAMRFMRARTSAFAGGLRMENVFHAGDRLVFTAHRPLRADDGEAEAAWRAKKIPLAPGGHETALEAAYYFSGSSGGAIANSKWRGGWGVARRRHPGHNASAKPETAGFISLQMEF